MKNIYFAFILLFLSMTGQSAVKTWNGSTDDKWGTSLNWTPAGVPGTGDIVIMDATGTNRNITEFTSTQLSRLVVSNAAGNADYSISSASDAILTITGGVGTDLDIQSGCSLTIHDHTLFTLDSDCDGTIAGTLATDYTSLSHVVTFSANTNVTVSGSILFSGLGTGGTFVVAAGATLEGTGDITCNLGTLMVNGRIGIEGNVTNSAMISGTGSVVAAGTWNNTGTIFGYPGNPPGEILSGFTWRGQTGTAWETGSNWWAGNVPVSTGDVVVYYSAEQPVVSSAGQSCRGLYIHNDGSVVTISPSGQLTATGKTSLGDEEGPAGEVALRIRSDATGTGSFIDNGTFDGAGVVSMERFLEYGSSGQWHFICVPMTSINAWTYFDQYMKYYDESEHHYRYVIAPADSILNSDGLGYAMWANLTDFTAVQNGIPNTGTMIIPVTRNYNAGTADFDGWNLVGNPYTSSVNLAVLAGGWNNTDGTAWFWDGSAGNFKAWPSGGAGTHSRFCPPGQGFFVHCNDPAATPSTPGSGFIIMNNAGRVHNTETFLKNSIPDLLNITIRGAPNDFTDELNIYFANWVTEGYDPGYDAEKLAGDVLAPQISTRAGAIDLTVNALPVPEGPVTVPLHFTAALPGSYMLSAGNLENFQATEEVSIEDTQTGVVQDLHSSPDYTFSHDPANEPGRFLLRFNGKAIGTGDTKSRNPVAIYSWEGSVIISSGQGGTLSGYAVVYDIIGRMVYRQNLNGSSTTRFSIPQSRGYYVVKVVTGETTIVRKLYLD